jgi:dTDP-4-dehydrorhamnose reductase
LLEELGPTNCIGASRLVLDLSFPSSLRERLDFYRPSAIINAAAYTQVDRAEQEEGLANKINAESPGVLSEWCADHGVPFVHLSTDYVFPGTGDKPWEETDPVGPLNIYGGTKLEGEKAVRKAGGRHLIFRTSWLYDAHGKNFVTTMLKLGRERKEVRVVTDQVGAPTYAPQLARAIVQGLRNACAAAAFPSGVYHLCNAGETSWHSFAEAIFQEARDRGLSLRIARVNAIPSSDYPTPAKRPFNSRLNTQLAARVLGARLPDWRSGLAECMEIIANESH